MVSTGAVKALPTSASTTPGVKYMTGSSRTTGWSGVGAASTVSEYWAEPARYLSLAGVVAVMMVVPGATRTRAPSVPLMTATEELLEL